MVKMSHATDDHDHDTHKNNINQSNIDLTNYIIHIHIISYWMDGWMGWMDGLIEIDLWFV